MRIAQKKLLLGSQMSIQTTECLAIFLVMQQVLRLDLDCLCHTSDSSAHWLELGHVSNIKGNAFPSMLWCVYSDYWWI